MKPREMLLTLGKTIRCQRNRKKLSQEKLAELGDFDRTYISLLERGLRNPSFTNLYKISKALGLSIPQLTKGIK